MDIDKIILPECCLDCPYDIDRENRPFCYCKYFVEYYLDQDSDIYNA